MPKKSTAIVHSPAIEVLPAPGRIPSDEQRLDQLVQQKVAEILAQREDFILEPFFRSRQVAYELRRLQNVPEQRKWAVFYERFGCLRCQDTQQSHAGSGMCERCRSWIGQALGRIVRELLERSDDDASGDLKPSA